MTRSDYEKLPTYSGMLTGGGIATVVGGVGLSILLTVGITTKVFLPTGFASLTMGATTVGVLLLVARLILRKVGEVRLDTIQSMTAMFDEIRVIRDEAAVDRSHLAQLANAARVLAEDQATLRATLEDIGAAIAEIRNASGHVSERQDEILALLAQQAQRYDHATKLLKAAVDALAARQSGAEEDIGDLVSDVRTIQQLSQGVSMLPKKRVDPPAPR